MKNYSYPLELEWTHQEMDIVVALWNAVESAYEVGINRDEFMKKYRAFKEVVPSKGEEKRLGNNFEKISGYSLYRVVQASKLANKMIKM